MSPQPSYKEEPSSHLASNPHSGPQSLPASRYHYQIPSVPKSVPGSTDTPPTPDVAKEDTPKISSRFSQVDSVIWITGHSSFWTLCLFSCGLRCPCHQLFGCLQLVQFHQFCQTQTGRYSITTREEGNIYLLWCLRLCQRSDRWVQATPRCTCLRLTHIPCVLKKS
ncbi:hypothetical protein Q5P01_010669 [Channa striata]|uniref:Uncharacterized protein n=1 Tax=Channa striata TaxID=64152 RepID=A0AA88MVJ8_CHASR|nr:hypothetical protein Q5P01_010669 [Channa striata]